MMGSVNYMTTIINMRAPGMTLFRMPMTIWSMFITAILQAFALPVLTAAGFMLVFDRLGRSCQRTFTRCSSFPPTSSSTTLHPTVGGGQPLLWQHLFWFYSHPAVYIMILPAMGMVSDMLSCMCRKPMFGYKPMVYSMAAIAGLGFIVWGHHMFTSGMNPALGMTFMISTMMIALAVGDQDVQLDRHDLGRRSAVQHGDAELLRLRVDVHHRRPDRHLHGRHAGRHLFPRHVLHRGPLPLRAVRATLFGVFAAIHFWFPKMFGREMNDTVQKWHFA